MTTCHRCLSSVRTSWESFFHRQMRDVVDWGPSFLAQQSSFSVAFCSPFKARTPIYPPLPPFHPLINGNKTEARMSAHAPHVHTAAARLSPSPHLHGNAIICQRGVMLEWLTMWLTTSLSKAQRKVGKNGVDSLPQLPPPPAPGALDRLPGVAHIL